MMDEREKSIRQKLKDDFPHYAQKCLKIRVKKVTSEGLKPFFLNKAQRHLHDSVEKQKREKGRVRVIIVKGRQQGISTYISGRGYHFTTHNFGVRSFILTHEEDATKNLFEMVERYHENCPEIIKPSTQFSNSRELVFGELDSGYRLGTAGNKGVGRSSTIQFFHGSEVALWPHADEHAGGILQCIPDQGTEVYLESTARGIGNYFHQQWQLAESGASDFLPVFLPWFWQEEYVKKVPSDFSATEEEEYLIDTYKLSNEQLMWRRTKVMELTTSGIDGAKFFKQEYPCNSIEAFQSSGDDNFILSDLVMRARKNHCEGYGALILGVDPARFGDDRSSLISRKGRKSYDLQSYLKKDLMELVGIVYQRILRDNPDKVCIDIGGLGAGVYDRLREILPDPTILVAVNFGSSPLNSEKYVRKRDEMWGNLLEWLQTDPVDLPDCDSLHSDLTSVKYSLDSMGRIIIESKEKLKKRGFRSPDEADALCLTFAEPVDMFRSKNSSEGKAKKLMAHSKRLAQRKR